MRRAPRPRAGFDFEAWLEATCASSGVPPRVDDAAALARVAVLLRKTNADPSP